MDEEKKDLKEIILNQIPRYLFNFVFAIFFGLFIAVLCNVPLKFLRTVNVDLASFAIGLIATVGFLLWRSIGLGYEGYIPKYQFDLKRAMLYIGICIALQILLTVLIGNVVYIEGPTFYLVNYLLAQIDRNINYRNPIYSTYHWVFMLAADVLIYVPAMLYGEYRGAKERQKETKK